MVSTDLSDDDVIVFAAEEQDTLALDAVWKILVVDDEAEVHRITRLVLADFHVDGRGLELLSAYSAEEAKTVLAQHEDIAAILLDVVMETDDAGLRLVGHIRDVIGNTFVRIILRTGQPGMAPERAVITRYEINDYRAKAELTATNLFTAVIVACRSYQDLRTIEASRRGLSRVINASSSLFKVRSMNEFLSGSLDQLSAILETRGDSLLCLRGYPSTGLNAHINRVEAAIGRFEPLIGRDFDVIPDPLVRLALEEAFAEKRTIMLSNGAAVFFQSRGGLSSAACIEGYRAMSPLDTQLVELFCAKAAIAFDNLLLLEQVLESQKATVFALAKMAEFKDKTTGGHLRRVEMITQAIADRLLADNTFGDHLDPSMVEKIGMASILHDVGKVAIPDAILMKPGKLDADEWVAMQGHAMSGAIMLEAAAEKVRGQTFLSIAAEIARFHHEKFDGSGYPAGLGGDAVPISARIVAVADVFDALMSRRPYKDGWTFDATCEWIEQQAGSHFDPRVVESFLSVMADDNFRAELEESYRIAA